MTRPNYQQYGRRTAVWCSYPEANHPLSFSTEFESLIPAQGSQWRQDRLSNFNGVQRHILWFVPDTQRNNPESDDDRGTITAYALRDLWEEFQTVSGLPETYLTGFDYATGAALGEYPRTWSSGWAGRPIYRLRSDFLQAVQPPLNAFTNQTPPRWSSVAKPANGPIESKHGQPAYLSLHLKLVGGYLYQARRTTWYTQMDHNEGLSILFHLTDAPLAIDYDKVEAMASAIVTNPDTPENQGPVLFPSAYRVALNDWPGVVDDRAYTDTWETAKQWILHSDTLLPIDDADLT